MRRLGTVSDRESATRLHDYLFVQGIDTQVDQNGKEWDIWVREEDQLALARSEFVHFLAQPDDLKYALSASTAKEMKARQLKEALDTRARHHRLNERWQGRQTRTPVTVSLILLSIGVAVVTRLGLDENAVSRFLFAEWYLDDQSRRVAYDTLWGIFKKHEYYRLVAPIFLHFGPFHLLFNMSATYAYGRAIEQRSGSGRMIGIVLLIALVSNLAQYYWTGPTFGGMSGVDFGMFGFLWMKSRFDPAYGVGMGRDYIVQSLFFLMLCMTGLLGPIANAAHLVGMGSGMILALIPLIPRIWRHLRPR